MLNRKGQTLLEYIVIIVIIAGALVAMKDYIKRGMQGRWKASVDDLGDQYDPRFVNSMVTHTMISNTDTYITAVNGLINGVNGQWTTREDDSHTIENKTGETVVAANTDGL